MTWPIYFKNLLTVGNLDSEVSIVTLWTKREDVEKNIDKNKNAVIGQPYSKDYEMKVNLISWKKVKSYAPKVNHVILDVELTIR